MFKYIPIKHILDKHTHSSNYLYKICLCSLYCLNVFFFCSCEKEVTNLVPKGAEARLVVTCFISPTDTLLRATLLRSLPVLATGQLSSNNILNGSIRLSDGATSVELIFNPKVQAYTADAARMPIVAGKNYFLEASEPSGLIARATCRVPAAPEPSLLVRVDSSQTTFGDGSSGYEYFVRMQWQDTPLKNNHYRVVADLKTKEIYGGEYYANSFPVDWPDEGRNQIMNDNDLDGAVLTSPIGFLTGLGQRTPVAQVYAYLLHTDKHYYLYHKTLRDSRADNPFAEPILLYTNIEGGLGVFAAYLKETVAVTIR
jgi:hypothetical protein